MTQCLPRIGQHELSGRAILAPMAGVTDRPFRQLCRRLGAALVVSEMVTADKRLWHTPKSRLRLDHRGEQGPRSVQIAGGDAAMLAEAARINADHGADIIDINMGCPAKKVCNKAAGSALMRDEPLVAEILAAVVAAVDIPVTLKIRTGWCENSRNALTIARLAEANGIAALAVHGRTREQRYNGSAEYDTIAEIKSQLSIPVFANGDIDHPERAREVLDYTGADALLIGRGAQGNPWIFREIEHYLRTGHHLAPPDDDERCRVMGTHLDALHEHYGEYMGVRIARKHIGWYLASGMHDDSLRQSFNSLTTPDEQHRFLARLFAGTRARAATKGTRAA
ncbi:tRNA dihydrouridine synthase DusB [Kushneria phosphatilytica]|uniref:tRNA-dihydrouridine synthase B n=1 Tax=Kushneria phosphatilytica TaxID=657387 RepID=A0A1S1NZ38_9GAMM|nr:tRNA dihydrouridine synthase DusB [Kushneria phosphatilytica]OHV13033.1 tRNA dihydrouridine synthase DusB [Kushneria phosphatilytica]QEL10904.1 tRNA dihydrouridine synthase DusB [Kushneria phosphatilytica]